MSHENAGNRRGRALRLAVVLALPFISDPAYAGNWSRVDRSTLKFEGLIEPGEYAKFSDAYDGNVRELIVNSDGGSAEDGLKIGLALAADDLKVAVVGHCLSSCANYLFVGGRRRELRGGIVGFHGNIGACNAAGPNRERAIAEMRRQGASDRTIRETLEREDKATREELRFLRIMGVEQELFVRTCTNDKGMGDGKSYVFLMPTTATFEKYGLSGVLGVQDPGELAKLRYPVVVD